LIVETVATTLEISGVVAQRSATFRRARRRKLIRLTELRDAVFDRLKEGWSPEQISGRLNYEDHPISVSHERGQSSYPKLFHKR